MRRANIVRPRGADSFTRATVVDRENRRTSRLFVRLPASITLDSLPHGEHVAFVRDISRRGIFFYSDFKPNDHECIAFVLEYRNGPKNIKLQLSGSVVRVEQAAPGSAIGVAVRFDCEHDEVPRRSIRAHWLETVARFRPVSRGTEREDVREVLVQERGTRTPRFIHKYPADQVPKVGAKLSVEGRNFVVMEKEHLLLKQDNRAVRGVLLIVEDIDALSW